MNKNLKVFLWILLTIVIIVFMYYLIKLIIFYFKAKDSIYTAWFNTKFCGQEKCPPTNYQLSQKLPTTIPTDNWDIGVARYSTVVVYSLEKAGQDNVKPTYPSELKVLKELYDSDSDPIFGAIFTEKYGGSTIWISFRGTLSTSEFAQDLTYQQESMFSKQSLTQVHLNFTKNSPGQTPHVHKGFLDVYNKFRQELLDTLKNVPKNTTIVISGHSLGASISTIVGVDLKQSGYTGVIVYNFASPRVGDQVFADLVDNELKLPLYRFVNLSDMIPNTPPSVCPNLDDTSQPYMYVHCGKLIPFQINRLSMLNNHLIPVYMQGLEDMSKN